MNSATDRRQRIDLQALRFVAAEANGVILATDVEAGGSSQSMRVFDYPIDRIRVGDRHRPLGDISTLAQSMAVLGQLQPVILTSDGKLIAGNHRIAAARHLGWSTVRAVVRDLDDLDAELAEIDENLRRNELTVLEQAEHLHRREEILVEKGMRASSGGQDRGEIVSPLTTADIADGMGISERSAQQRLQIARSLQPAVKRRIESGPIANSTTQLLELARMTPAEQEHALDLIEQGTVPSVRHAAAIMALNPDARTIILDSTWRNNLPELVALAKIHPNTQQRLVADALANGSATSVAQFFSQFAPGKASYDSVVASDASGSRQMGAPLGKCRACNRPLYDPAQAAQGIGACCAARRIAGAGGDGASPTTEDTKDDISVSNGDRRAQLAQYQAQFEACLVALPHWSEATGHFVSTAEAKRGLRKLIEATKLEIDLLIGKR